MNQVASSGRSHFFFERHHQLFVHVRARACGVGLREARDEQGPLANRRFDRILPAHPRLNLLPVDPRKNAARLQRRCQALDTLVILTDMREEDVGFGFHSHSAGYFSVDLRLGQEPPRNPTASFLRGRLTSFAKQAHFVACQARG